MAGVDQPVLPRELQGLIGSIVNNVIGDGTTPSPTPANTPVPTTKPPTTRAPTSTTRISTPTTRTPTPTTKTPTPATLTPASTTKTPQSVTVTPTPTSTPAPTPELSSSGSVMSEAPELTNATAIASFSASLDTDITTSSNSSSGNGSNDKWNLRTDSQVGGSMPSGQDAEGVTDQPALDSWMIVAITLAAVAAILLIVGLLAWRFGRIKRRTDDSGSNTLQQHLIADKPGIAMLSEDTANSILNTSSTDLNSAHHIQYLDGGGYSSSFLTAAQAGMWEDDTITAMRVPFEKLKKGKLLNKGGYGMVYRGTYRGEAVAIKMLLPDSRKTMRQINAFLSEIKLMAAMEHPRIVRLIGVAWDSLSDLCSVTEFMEAGDLRSNLNYMEWHEHRPHGFDLEKARIALHVAHSLTYLHSLDPLVLHRDLKSKNILLTANGDAKITDFGVSRESNDRTMTAGVGTSLWMAPEVMMGDRYGVSADIFSFGVVLSELDAHVLPYAAAKETDSGRVIPDTALLQLVSLGRLRIEFSPHAPQALVDLAHACVDLDPEARPSAGEVLYQLQLIMNIYQQATM